MEVGKKEMSDRRGVELGTWWRQGTARLGFRSRAVSEFHTPACAVTNYVDRLIDIRSSLTLTIMTISGAYIRTR